MQILRDALQTYIVKVRAKILHNGKFVSCKLDIAHQVMEDARNVKACRCQGLETQVLLV